MSGHSYIKATIAFISKLHVHVASTTKDCVED